MRDVDIKKTVLDAGGNRHYRVEIRCDALEDITPPDPDWLVGSLAAVADEQSIYMLKSNGTWVDMMGKE